MVFLQNGNVVNVNMLETGSESINIDMKLKSEVTFQQAEELKINFKNLVQNKMDSAGVIEDFVLDFSRNIAKDISHTVISFEGEYDRNVSEIAICGGGSVVPNLKENILENFDGNISVKRLNSQNIVIADANVMHEENIPRFAQCIGMILMQI
jgi:cell division ATPase FtsA